jgi:hypothetical protein
MWQAAVSTQCCNCSRSNLKGVWRLYHGADPSSQIRLGPKQRRRGGCFNLPSWNALEAAGAANLRLPSPYRERPCGVKRRRGVATSANDNASCIATAAAGTRGLGGTAFA